MNMGIVGSAQTWPPGDGAGRGSDLALVVEAVGRGDQAAFERLYEQVAGPVYGLALRVVRNPAQAEEVAQEVLVELWRTASRYARARGSVMSWVMTITHRRAVDRVRSAQSASSREERTAHLSHETAHDAVAENVETRLEGEQVRRCLDSLTDLQRQSVTLAYYGGYSYPEVARKLRVPLGTVKTRMRDGLHRLRDCIGTGL
jgi:RNA polymerase sigma-70 factor, ECF subfamily